MFSFKKIAIFYLLLTYDCDDYDDDGHTATAVIVLLTIIRLGFFYFAFTVCPVVLIVSQIR